jgi:hypothetical protein
MEKPVNNPALSLVDMDDPNVWRKIRRNEFTAQKAMSVIAKNNVDIRLTRIISILQFWILGKNLKYYLLFSFLAFIFYIAVTSILGNQLMHYHPILDKDSIEFNKISPALLGSFALMTVSFLSKSRYYMFLGLLFAGFALIVPNDFQRLLYGVDFLFLPLILIIILARVRNLHFYLIIVTFLIGYGEFFSVLIR